LDLASNLFVSRASGILAICTTHDCHPKITLVWQRRVFLKVKTAGFPATVVIFRGQNKNDLRIACVPHALDLSMLANTDPSSTLLFAAALAADHALTISFNLWFGTALLLAILFLFLLLKLMPSLTYRSMEISEVELGIGQQKITLRPNTVDKQVAYQIWVELSTRKLGIPVDIEKDIIVEVYTSWYKVWGQRVWGQSENS